MHVRTVKIHRGQAGFCREISDPRAVRERERIRQDDERVGTPVLRCLESAVEILGSRLQGFRFNCERPSHFLQLSQLRGIDGGISEDRDAGYARYDLLENLQVLAAQLREIEKQPGNVASRPGDACH